MNTLILLFLMVIAYMLDPGQSHAILCYFPLAMIGKAAGAVGGASGGAAAGGAAGGGGMLSKLGGMGGKGGGGGGGGGMFSSMINAGNKPLKATLGLATGLLQGLQASKAKKRAEAAFPELVDPNQAAHLAELRQRSRSVETGADYAEGMKSADQTNAGTNQAILRSTGGDVGGTIQALLQSEAATGSTKNQIVGQGQAQQFNYDSAVGAQLNLIAQRSMELKMQRSQQAMAEWDSKSKLASANAMEGITSLAPGGNSANQPAINAQTAGSMPDYSQLAMSGKPTMAPQATMETTGIQSPKVVPVQPDGIKVSGVPINLK